MLQEPLQYRPFLRGLYSTAPALLAMNKAESEEDRLVFQLDNTYEKYILNKADCRSEDIKKYYCEQNFMAGTARGINQYLVNKLVGEHPNVFTFCESNESLSLTNRLKNEILTWKDDWLQTESDIYLSLFDALCSQVQEDIAVCQIAGDKDWLATLHLCAPNHWAAQEKIGKPFDFVHADVPGMEKTMLHYFSILNSIVNKGPFTRFAWGIATDDRLNHHPSPPPGTELDDWKGRDFSTDTSELFLRVERQNLIGFPSLQAFLFTIRTYFYKVNTLEKDQKTRLLMAVESMSEASLQYKGLSGKAEELRKLLSISF